ncbi:MAG: phage head closure protein, partial [Pseudonocardiaceae bacterium]
LAVWRRALTPDGAGGRTANWSQVGTVAARVSQPTAAERLAAGQAGAGLTNAIYLLPGADVQRNDELAGDGQVFRVHATVHPSGEVYLRADCVEIQPESGAEVTGGR